MEKSYLWLQCLEIAMKPVRARSYNYDMLKELANAMFPDNTPIVEKIQKMMELMDGGTNEINIDPKINMSISELNFTFERTPQLKQAMKMADIIYAEALSKIS